MSRYIGDKTFYRRAFALALPIIIQSGITNFVNMLDNLMVGSVGTEAITGVAVSNQLIFIMNLCIFGAISGAGIFTAQFYGKGDITGVRHTFRFKIIFCILIALLFSLTVILKGDFLLGLYLRGEGDPATAKKSAEIAVNYIRIILIGSIPYALSQSYGSTLRETGRARLPMYAGILAVIVNLSLNYCLIFGHFGFPELGVQGAAIATTVSRFVELLYIAVMTRIKGKNEFIIGAFKSLYVPPVLVKQMIIKGMPLLTNELLFSGGIAFINQCYSVRGLNVVAANNIAITFFNVFSVTFMSMGVAVGIIVGQLLGSDKHEEVMDTAIKMRALAVFTGIVIGIIFALVSGLIPKMYNTTDEVRNLARWFIVIYAAAMPIDAFAQSSYFILRSGGKIIMALIFDGFFVWAVSVPLALIISRLTTLPIIPFVAAMQAINILKCILGYIYVKKGVWMKNLTTILK